MKAYRSTAILIIVFAVLSLSCKLFTPVGSPTAPGIPPTPSPIPGTTEPAPPGPTPAPSSTPAGLNPDGPYVVYGGQGGVWISNPDGSYLTQITSFPIENQYDLHRLISPHGDRMAVVVNSEGALDLLEISIPGGEPRHITQLITLSNEDLVMNPTSDKAFATYAVRDYDNIAWQPGAGRLLAFMGAMDGPTSDLYLYDTELHVVTQMTDGESQAIFPTWSPDGKYILHYGVSWRPPFGGALVGYTNLDGAWAVRAEDGKIIPMPTPKSVTLNFVGWQDEGHYITYDSDLDCYSKNLRSVELSSGKTTPITDLSFYYGVARSPENGAFLFAGAEGCADSPGEGVFLLSPGETTPRKLLSSRAYEVKWMPENGLFWAYPEALVTSNGSVRYEAPLYDKSFEPAISKKGYQAWEVLENFQGRVEVSTNGADWQTILKGKVNGMTWDPVSGETLLIVLEDDTLYSASSPDFVPQAMGTIAGGASQIIWLP